MSDIENVIIIGSGPAGHTAAVYTARADLNPLMFEGFMAGGLPGGQLMTTTEVENYPGFPEGVSGPEMMTLFRKQSERFGTRLVTQDVDAVDLSVRPYKVTSGGKDYFARALIIATGASAKYMGLESEQRLLNRGVSACATCDGALPVFRGKELVVVGGGDTAMEEATFLTRFASKVTLVHRRDVFRASKIMLDRVRQHPKIDILENTVVDEVLGEDAVTGVRLRNVVTDETTVKEAAGMFVAIGHQPNTGIFGDALETDEMGYLVTEGKSSKTGLEGVFACGDVQDHIYRQAVTAAGSGCMAAIDCERWLEAEGR
ncbi:MAG: thioredoxin-disulfide reductase [Myxococcota bacterium]|nr:thioredoxin-disulfide reductase [Myxococcota bacterium]